MPSAWNLIASTTLTSTTATVTFSGISTSAYLDLQVYMSARTDFADSKDSVRWYTQESCNYGRHFYRALQGSAVTVGFNQNISTPSLLYVAGNTAPANSFSSTYFYAPAYYTTGYKQYYFKSEAGNTGEQYYVCGGSASGLSSAATTSLSFTSANGANFVAGSTFNLYGTV